MTYSQEERLSMETYHWIAELMEKNYKAAIINVFKDSKENVAIIIGES